MNLKLTHVMKAAVAATSALACAAAISQTGPIKIGVVTPLSGTYAGIGQQVKWGLDLAAAQINAAGGVMGRRLELIYEDEEANPAVAVQKAEKLLQVSKVDFLTGTVNSGSTLAVGQVAERNGRLIATTVSFADSITGDKCSPNVFRVNARAGMQSAALADWMAQTRPNANVFYLGPDYEMGRSTVAAFKAAAESKGAKSVGEVFAPLDNKDYSPFFGQMRAARPTSTPRWRATILCACSRRWPNSDSTAMCRWSALPVPSPRRICRPSARRETASSPAWGIRQISTRPRTRSSWLSLKPRTRLNPTYTAPTATACCSFTRRQSRRPRAPKPTRSVRPCEACSGPLRKA